MSHESRLIRGLTGGRAVRVVIAEMRRVANEMRRAHGLGRDAARLAAEGAVASALMSAHVKGDERITLQVQAERPRFSFLGDLGADGWFRGRVSPVDLPFGRDERIDGILLAIKANATRELYRGTTAIEGQTLEQALAGHLVQSSQVHGILKIGVLQDDDGEITFAGGFLAERLPEHPEHPWLTPEEFEERFGSLIEQPAENVMTEMAFGRLAGSPLELLEVREVVWRCRCSTEKVEATIGSLGAQVLEELIEEGRAEITCHFCNRSYEVGVDRLRELLAVYSS